MIKLYLKKIGIAGLLGALVGCGTNKQSIIAIAAATDTTAPTITAFTATPSVLTNSAERVVLLVSATDNVAPAKVEFYRALSAGSTAVMGLVFTDTSAPYSNAFTFSSSLKNGTYSYIAKAFDAAGNVSVAKQASYRVDIPCTTNCTVPTINLTASPSLLTNIGTVKLIATSNASKVEFYRVQGTKETFLFADTNAPFELPFMFTNEAQNGTYNYKAIALSSTGSSTNAAASFVVDMDTTSPQLSLVASNTNITTPETLTLTANASDNRGVTRVEFYTDSRGTFLGTDTTAPYTYTTNITSANNGSTYYTAYAYDAANNMAYLISPLQVNVAISASGFQWLPDVSMFGKTTSISRHSLALGADGKPIMAWSEYDGSTAKVYVQRWSGSSWVHVGAPNQALNVAMNANTYNPALAVDATGNPVVTWSECDTNYDNCNIYVKRWNGTAWVLLGDGPLDSVVANTAIAPDITMDSGSGYPVLTWKELDSSTNTYVNYVKHWNGTTWVLLSGTSTTFTTSKAPVVVWSEKVNDVSNVYARRWSGTGWALLGGALNIASANSAERSSFALDASGNPVVAWTELNGSTANTYVKRWNGASWVLLGDTLNVGTNTKSNNLSLALDASGNPVVAWYEFDSVTYLTSVYIKRWNGTTWALMGDGALDSVVGNDIDTISTAVDASGNPVVAWTKFDNMSKFLIRIKKFYP